MANSKESMKQVLEQYFLAWTRQDSNSVARLFTDGAIYKVKPFGIEEYRGKDQIKEYWETHPVRSQLNPRPRILNSAFGNDICFAEWENTFTTRTGNKKRTLGLMVLEFEDGLIKELREHYLSTEDF